MSFTLINKTKKEELEIPHENYTIKELAEDLELPSQSHVYKKNNQIVIDETVIEDGDEIKTIQILYGD